MLRAATVTDSVGPGADSGRGQAVRVVSVFLRLRLTKSNQVRLLTQSGLIPFYFQFREKLITEKKIKNEDVPLVVFISVALPDLHACQVRFTSGDSGLCSVILVLRISSAIELTPLFVDYLFILAKLTTA